MEVLSTVPVTPATFYQHPHAGVERLQGLEVIARPPYSLRPRISGSLVGSPSMDGVTRPGRLDLRRCSVEESDAGSESEHEKGFDGGRDVPPITKSSSEADILVSALVSTPPAFLASASAKLSPNATPSVSQYQSFFEFPLPATNSFSSSPPLLTPTPTPSQRAFFIPPSSDASAPPEAQPPPHFTSPASNLTSNIPVLGERNTPRPFFEKVQVVEGSHRAPAVDMRQESEKMQDARTAKKWHVLQELLETERAYVSDLLILVQIYIPSLPQTHKLTPQQRASIAKNARAILEFHQGFAVGLEELVCAQDVGRGKSEDGSERQEGNAKMGAVGLGLETVIEAVARRFAQEANNFSVYEAFCSDHSEVVDALRRTESRSKNEWGRFEKACASAASELGGSSRRVSGALPNSAPDLPASPTSPQWPPSPPPPTSAPPTRTHFRRHSMDTASLSPSSAGTSGHKLAFQEYLIKPIQRLCQYPLLLGQLLGKDDGSQTSKVVEEAVGAMKSVVSQVNGAKARKENLAKSASVVDRMDHSVLDAACLNSLGGLVLCGALDVVHHHPSHAPLTTPIKVRYMGVFIFPSFILFAKVKKGKIYEPRYWFQLENADIIDVNDQTSLLEHSLRVSCSQHHFELAASCPAEKGIWLAALESARSMECKARDLPPFKLLSTTSSAPSPACAEDDNIAKLEELGSLQRLNRTTSSTSSVKSFFVYDTSLILKRCTRQYRDLVDRGLEDVSSDQCLGARAYAQRVRSRSLHEKRTEPPPMPELIIGREYGTSGGVIARGRAIISETLQSPPSPGCTSSSSGLVRAKSFSFLRRGIQEDGNQEGGGPSPEHSDSETKRLRRESAPAAKVSTVSVFANLSNQASPRPHGVSHTIPDLLNGVNTEEFPRARVRTQSSSSRTWRKSLRFVGEPGERLRRSSVHHEDDQGGAFMEGVTTPATVIRRLSKITRKGTRGLRDSAPSSPAQPSCPPLTEAPQVLVGATNESDVNASPDSTSSSSSSEAHTPLFDHPSTSTPQESSGASSTAEPTPSISKRPQKGSLFFLHLSRLTTTSSS
ncbi:hypothetical protein BOTBODRAFT_173897 [Botryobasidium botryosum FD-172 SS1]|uniref:DH domain-containing protein n=1 Tax=Botryobasidium botryosum (strain FD-172 SS1) TaxID=930990 RepID=A0A067MU89_BOTB1|nr:hypothetical protein BOTBODRAFT_173897 [Botryobasidium botryosum FD-172 SS1]